MFAVRSSVFGSIEFHKRYSGSALDGASVLEPRMSTNDFNVDQRDGGSEVASER